MTTTLFDWKLDKDGDLDISAGKIQMVQGVEALQQRLDITLSILRGECFRDRTRGIPIGAATGKVTNKNALDTMYKQQILRIKGVQSITRFFSTLDPAKREYKPFFEVAHSELGTVTFPAEQ